MLEHGCPHLDQQRVVHLPKPPPKPSRLPYHSQVGHPEHWIKFNNQDRPNEGLQLQSPDQGAREQGLPTAADWVLENWCCLCLDQDSV